MTSSSLFKRTWTSNFGGNDGGTKRIANALRIFSDNLGVHDNIPDISPWTLKAADNFGQNTPNPIDAPMTWKRLAQDNFGKNTPNVTRLVPTSFRQFSDNLGFNTPNPLDAPMTWNRLAQDNSGTFAPFTGAAAGFIAANHTYLEHADDAALEVPNGTSFTWVCWVNFKSFPNEGGVQEYALVWKGSTASAALIEYVIRYEVDVGIGGTANRFSFTVGDGSVTGVVATANTFGAASLNTWYLVVAKFDSSVNKASISINNGAFDTSAAGNGCFAGTHQFLMGRDDTSQRYVDGALASVGFAKQLLTANDITELYNSGQGKQYVELSTGLSAKFTSWWDLNEAQGATRNDSAGGPIATGANSSGNATSGLTASTGSFSVNTGDTIMCVMVNDPSTNTTTFSQSAGTATLGSFTSHLAIGGNGVETAYVTVTSGGTVTITGTSNGTITSAVIACQAYSGVASVNRPASGGGGSTLVWFISTSQNNSWSVTTAGVTGQSSPISGGTFSAVDIGPTGVGSGADRVTVAILSNKTLVLKDVQKESDGSTVSNSDSFDGYELMPVINNLVDDSTGVTQVGGVSNSFLRHADASRQFPDNFGFNDSNFSRLASAFRIISDNYGIEAPFTNGAAEFTGFDYLSRASNSSLQVPNGTNFTLACWVNLNVVPSSGNVAVILSKESGFNDAAHTEYQIDYINSTPSGFEMTCGDGTNLKSAKATTTATAGTWYFLVAQFDSSVNECSISVNNGAFTASTAGNGTITGTGSFFIGCGFTASPVHNMTGVVDSVGFWKRLLTAAEITQLYNEGRGRIYSELIGTLTTNLISWWDLGEATGATRNDSAGSNNLTDNFTVYQVSGVSQTFLRIANGIRQLSDNTGYSDAHVVEHIYDFTSFSAAFLGICLGSDGNLWACDASNGAVWQITPGGVGTEFVLTASSPVNICAGPDGNLWVSDANGNVWKVTTGGASTSYTIGGIPAGICAGPDGNLWVLDVTTDNGKAWKVTTGGATTSYSLTGFHAGVSGSQNICAGSDGNLWACGVDTTGAAAVWKITTAGSVTEFVNASAVEYFSICSGPDGNLWTTDPSTQDLWQVTTGGVFSNIFSLGVGNGQSIINGPDGNLWFVSAGAEYIGSFNIATTTLTTFLLRNAVDNLQGVCIGPSSDLWITDGAGFIINFSISIVTRQVNALRQNSDNLGFHDSFTSSPQRNRLLSDNLGLHDKFILGAMTWLRLYADNFAQTDSTQRIANAIRIVSDNFGFNTPTASVTPVRNRVIPDNLGVSDQVFDYRTFLRLIADNMGFHDVATLTFGFRTWLVSLSDNLGVSDAFFRIANGLRIISDNLGVSDSVSDYRNVLRVLSDNLALNDPGPFHSAMSWQRLFSDNFAQTDTTQRLANAFRTISSNLGITDAEFDYILWLVFITDNFGMHDSTQRLANANRQFSDNLGVTDTTSRLANAFRIISDNLGLNDQVIRSQLFQRLLSDNFGFNNASASRIVTFLRLFADNLALSDTTSRLANAIRLFSDNLGVTDTTSRLASAFRIFSNNLGITDTVSDYRNVLRLVSDNVALSDTTSRILSVFRIISDNLGITDTFSREADAHRLISDNLALSDSVSDYRNILRRISDNAALSDTTLRHADAFRSISDNLALTDTFSRVANAFRNIADNLGVTDTTSRTANANRLITDNSGLHDTVFDYRNILSLVTNNLGVTDTTSRLADAFRIFSDNVGLTDTFAREADAFRIISDNLGLSDFTQNQSSYKKSISDNFGFTDAFSREADAFRQIADNLGFTDAFSREADAFRIISDNLGFTDVFSRLANAFRIISDNLALTDLAQFDIVKSILISDFLGFSDNAFGEGVRIILASDNLGMSDTTQRVVAFYRLLADSLALESAVLVLVHYSSEIDIIGGDDTKIGIDGAIEILGILGGDDTQAAITGSIEILGILGSDDTQINIEG